DLSAARDDLAVLVRSRRLALPRAGDLLLDTFFNSLPEIWVLGLLGLGRRQPVNRGQTGRRGDHYHTLTHRTIPFKKRFAKNNVPTERLVAVDCSGPVAGTRPSRSVVSIAAQNSVAPRINA